MPRVTFALIGALFFFFTLLFLFLLLSPFFLAIFRADFVSSLQAVFVSREKGGGRFSFLFSFLSSFSVFLRICLIGCTSACFPIRTQVLWLRQKLMYGNNSKGSTGPRLRRQFLGRKISVIGVCQFPR